MDNGLRWLRATCQAYALPGGQKASGKMRPVARVSFSSRLWLLKEFIGDAILSVFGAPLRNPLHAEAWGWDRAAPFP